MADIIDTSINKFLEEQDLYQRTGRVFNDYWYIWTHSGLLEFICVMIKQRYQVPTLDAEEDYSSCELPVGDSGVFVDSHVFFDAWDKKTQFQDELEQFIAQLRLPRLTFDSLFERIFYGIPLNAKEQWYGEDTNSVFVPLGLIKAKSYGKGTYTRKETVDIKNKIKTQLPNGKLSPEINEKIEDYSKKLVRSHRAIQNRELYVETIREMKRYHKRMWVDYSDDPDAPDTTGNKQISEKCATRISTKLGIDNFDSRAFRRLVGRLYKEFPVLKLFIEKVDTT